MSQVKPDIYGISNPFTQVNISKEANTSSYDNAEVLAMAQGIYHYAQQKASRILPHLTDVGTTNGLFFVKPIFGKFEWKIRTKNYEDTPHSQHTNSKRAGTCVRFHAGHIMDRDDIRSTSYMIQPQVQMELSYSLGRNIDELIMSAFYSPVLEYSSTASVNFQGLPTPSTKDLPDTSKIVLGTDATASSMVLSQFNEKAIDDLVKFFEDKDHRVQDICIIMTPEVRRSLKRIKSFRDRENTQHLDRDYDENAQTIKWKGITWISISKNIQPNNSLTTATDKFLRGKRLSTVASSGVALSTFVGYANRQVTFAFIKTGVMFRTPSQYAYYSRVAPRRDKGDAEELYTRAAFGGLRIDDSAVATIVFGDNLIDETP